MITGTTTSGFQFELDTEALDDYELLEILQKMDEGNYGLVTKVSNMLLGEEQANALKEHVRNDKGRVLASKMVSEIADIFQSSKEGKNS